MQREEEAHEGGQEASRFLSKPPRKREDQSSGEPQSAQDVSPGRGDQFFNLAIRDHFTEAEIIDFTGGEIEEVGDASAVLRMCEKLLPVVRNLPQWKEPKWDKNVTVGKILSHISDTIKLWNSNTWETYIPVAAITYGDPRGNYRTGKANKERNPNVWVLWAYETSQLATMPEVSFLPDLKKKSPALYNILCITIGKLNTKAGIHLWDYMTDMGEFSDPDSKDSWPNEEPDPEFTDEYESAQVDVANYWKHAGPTMKYVRSVSKTPMVRLKRMVRNYKWNSAFKKKVKHWVEAAIVVIESKNSIHEYHVDNLIWMHDDWAMHPRHYTWFRWFGERSGNYIEENIDQALENNYNEGGFYPFRKLFKYTDDKEFQKVKDDGFPLLLDGMMVNALKIFNTNFMKRFKK